MFGRPFFLAIFIVFAWTSQAVSGAWPREKGEAFLSIAGRPGVWNGVDSVTLSFYGEYGVSDRLTLAGKALYDFSAQDLVANEASLRWHFPERDQYLRKAISLTVADGHDGVRVKPGVHLGRGLQTPVGPGWVDVELFTSVPIGAPIGGNDIDYGGYGVLGLKPQDSVMTMLGVDVFAASSGISLKAIPAIAWEFMPGRHLNVQYSKGLRGVEEEELELGLWLAF